MKDNFTDKFESIYNKESDNVFRFCLLRVSSKEQAIDITQETFLRLWQSISSGQEILNDRAFIFTVARRLVIDWYRKKKSLTISSLDNDEEFTQFDIPDKKSSLNNSLLEAEGRYFLEKINDLPTTYREPLYLRFVEDLSPVQIGEILGISSNAASVRINRGLLILKKDTGYDKKSNGK